MPGKTKNAPTAATPYFTPAALTFLRNLAKHNERDWFTPRKAEFEALLKEPMLAVVRKITDAMLDFARTRFAGKLTIIPCLATTGRAVARGEISGSAVAGVIQRRASAANWKSLKAWFSRCGRSDHKESTCPASILCRRRGYPTTMIVWRARRGASLRMSAAEIATQPAVGVRPTRARWKKIALPRPLARREKFWSSTNVRS